METAGGRLLDFPCVSDNSLCILGFGSGLHIKNRHIISGKHAQELYADFYMPPKCVSQAGNAEGEAGGASRRGRRAGAADQVCG